MDCCFLTDHEGNILASMSEKYAANILKQMYDNMEDKEDLDTENIYVELKQKVRLIRKGELILRLLDQCEEENPTPLTKEECNEIAELILSMSKQLADNKECVL